MQEKILTPEQVAEILQIHQYTVLKFIKQGKLQASKLGRVYRIKESDVEAFLDEASSKKKQVKNSEHQKQKQISTSTPEKMTGDPTQISEVTVIEYEEKNKKGGHDTYYILK